MSKAELLANALDASRLATRLANASEEPHIVIGDDRVITVPDELKRIAVQYDHDIETVTFDCPRYWDEHDMSKMGIYINYLCADQESGIYQAVNVRVDEKDSSVMHFDWTISRNITFVSGQIAFLVCVRSIDADGFEKNHWNSEICTSCYVSKGLEYDGESIERIMYPDLIEQWRKKVIEITDDIAAKRDNGDFNGATFTPQVDSRGYISWTNDKGLPNPNAINIRGPRGISPAVTVTKIQGGHRIQIDAENYSGYFDVMDTIIDSSDAVNELLNRFITVGSVQPTVGPGLWFNASGHKAANHAEMHVINADGTNTPIYPDSVEVGYSASSEDGLKYTVTVPGLRKLENGTSFIIIPEVDNDIGTVSLSVNDLGELPLVSRRGWNSDITSWGKRFLAGDIKAYIPIRLTLSTKNGTCWIAEIQKVKNNDFEGALTIDHGGTGTDNPEEAIETFLGMAPVILSQNQYDAQFPSNPRNGQLFFKSKGASDDVEGVYIYEQASGKWNKTTGPADKIVLNESQYGSSFPVSPAKGQVFFRTIGASLEPKGIYIYNGTTWQEFLTQE